MNIYIWPSPHDRLSLIVRCGVGCEVSLQLYRSNSYPFGLMAPAQFMWRPRETLAQKSPSEPTAQSSESISSENAQSALSSASVTFSASLEVAAPMDSSDSVSSVVPTTATGTQVSSPSLSPLPESLERGCWLWVHAAAFTEVISQWRLNSILFK